MRLIFSLTLSLVNVEATQLSRQVIAQFSPHTLKIRDTLHQCRGLLMVDMKTDLTLLPPLKIILVATVISLRWSSDTRLRL